MTHSIQTAEGQADGGLLGSSRRTEGYLPIEDYAAIGDGHTIGLVGIDGSIDWLCLPDIDAPTVFGALLDPARGGRFSLRPAIPYEATRRYLERTAILETTFETAEGRVRAVDALTIDTSQPAPWRELVRRVEGLSGRVPMVWIFEPRFNYGRWDGSLSRASETVLAGHGGLQVGLQSWGAGEPQVKRDRAGAEFDLEVGDQALLVLQAADRDPLPLPSRSSIERRLQDTIEVWRSWVTRHSYDGPWNDAIERSLLTIRLLTDARQGAIVAAGTTSLPEVLGGERNYDYRFGWVRDVSFTLDALLAVDLHELTHASVSWLLAATERTHPRVDPIYALDGQIVRSQSRLPLAGYRGSGPVHLGNNAGSQLQLGGLGDLLETLYTYTGHGHVLTQAIGERLADCVDLLSHIWKSADAGLWELEDQADYTTSKVSCWVAFDRTLKLVQRGQVPARHLDRWRRAREELRDYIETRLWSDEKHSYRFKAGSDELDCGTLLLARRGFLDPRGERMNATIDALHSELRAEGPLFYRYSGMQSEENAFLACSFWMVEALAAAHRFEEAAELMDGVLALSNDVGLFSEEIEPGSHALRGNMPQALTHLALINAAVMFARCQREAGPDATGEA